MKTFEVTVNYSYRVYDEKTVTIQAVSAEDIGDNEVADAVSGGLGFSEDEELQVDDYDFEDPA